MHHIVVMQIFTSNAIITHKTFYFAVFGTWYQVCCKSVQCFFVKRAVPYTTQEIYPVFTQKYQFVVAY